MELYVSQSREKATGTFQWHLFQLPPFYFLHPFPFIEPLVGSG